MGFFIWVVCPPNNHLKRSCRRTLWAYTISTGPQQSDRPWGHLASSNHVVGAYGTQETITPNEPFLPDSFYGASKVFGEPAKLFFVKEGVIPL